MKHLNRFISLFMTVCMLSSAVTAAATETSGKGALELHHEISGLFEKYGLINENTDLGAIVTRGGFAAALAKLELGGTIPPAEKRFADINDEETNSSVSCLVDMGVISGYPDGNFYPERKITYGQALLMLLRTINITYGLENEYTVFAKAHSVGLTDKLDLSVTDTFDYSQCYALLYNLLFAEIPHEAYDIIGTANDLAPYYNRRLALFYIEGIVTDDGMNSFTGESSLHENVIKVDNIALNYSGDKSGLLGKSVICWYEETNNDMYEVVCLSESKRNRIINVPSELLYDFTNNKYEYSLDEFEDKTYKTSISNESVVVYNGKTVSRANASNFNANMLTPEYGRIILLDNNSDGCAELVRVEDYKYFVVSNVDIYNEKLYFRQTAIDGETPHETMLDLSSCDYSIRKNGSAVAIDRLAVGDVLAVMKDLNNDYIIEASNKTVSGSVEELITDKNKAVINGGAYIYSKNVNLSGGTAGKFFLAFDGVIAYFELQDSEMMLGYLYAKSKPESLSQTIKVRIFDQNGVNNTFELSEKVYIDDVRYTDGQKMYDALDADPQNADSFAGIVMYKLMGGKIKKIDLAAPASENWTDGFRIAQQAADRETGTYLAKNGSGNWKFVITDQTVCFKVAADSSEMEKRAKVYKGPASNAISIKDWTAYYTSGDKLGADVFLYKTGGGETVGDDERIQLITDTKLVYRDEETMYSITYIGQGGGQNTKFAEKEDVEKTVNVNGTDITLTPGPGDLVRTASSEDQITLMEYVYDYDSGYLNTEHSLLTNNSNADYYDLKHRVGFGWIEKTDQNAFYLKQTLPTVTSGGEPIDYVFANNFPIYIVRNERNGLAVTGGSLADMKPRNVISDQPSFVFYSTRFAYPDYVVIYDDVDDESDVPAAVRMR